MRQWKQQCLTCIENWMSNESKIWDFLYGKLKNPYGTAGLMGNIYVESKFKPTNLQNSYETKLHTTDAEYTEYVDNGVYKNFVNDHAGYGLVQWTYWSRKEGLLNFAKQTNRSIGDLDMQLEYIWKELHSYKNVLNVLLAATSVEEASDAVCSGYEGPGDQSESARRKRSDYGLTYFHKYYKATPDHKSVRITGDHVNIRQGNGTNFPRITSANKGTTYNWIATAENGWNAVLLTNFVGWVSGQYSQVE